MRALRSDGLSIAPIASSRERSSATVRGSVLAEIVEQVGEGSLGDVGRRHDHQHRAAQRAMQRREQCRARGRDRFVKRVSRAGSRRSNAIEQRRERAAGRFQALEEKVAQARRRGARCGNGHGALIIADSALVRGRNSPMSGRLARTASAADDTGPSVPATSGR